MDGLPRGNIFSPAVSLPWHLGGQQFQLPSRSLYSSLYQDDWLYSSKYKWGQLREFSITLLPLSFCRPRCCSAYNVIQIVSKLNSYFSLKQLEKNLKWNSMCKTFNQKLNCNLSCGAIPRKGKSDNKNAEWCRLNNLLFFLTDKWKLCSPCKARPTTRIIKALILI